MLAVLVAGLFLRATLSREVTPAGWLLGRSVWRYVEFAVSGLLFAFLGLELTSVLGETELSRDGRTLEVAGAVLAVLVLLRAAAMFTASTLSGRRARRAGSATPYGWRESAVASWAGMRGVVSVATALALPSTVDGGGAFPEREQVVLVALVVVLVTLVLQGLTLAPLIRRLGVASSADLPADTRRVHRLAAQAALEHLRGVADVDAAVRAAVVQQYESRLSYRTQVDELVDGDAGSDGDGDGADQQLRRLLARATEAEREAVLQARRLGQVSPAAADNVLFDVEARALRYDS